MSAHDHIAGYYRAKANEKLRRFEKPERVVDWLCKTYGRQAAQSLVDELMRRWRQDG